MLSRHHVMPHKINATFVMTGVAIQVQALARGLCGDLSTGSMPQPTLDVVDAVVAQLTPLLDIDADISHLQPQGAVDEGYMRLAAASALLRLSRVHDAKLPVEAYFTLALTMQVISRLACPPHLRPLLSSLSIVPPRTGRNGMVHEARSGWLIRWICHGAGSCSGCAQLMQVACTTSRHESIACVLAFTDAYGRPVQMRPRGCQWTGTHT